MFVELEAGVLYEISLLDKRNKLNYLYYRVVSATDGDGDILSYTILSGNLNDDFTLEPDTGVLYTNTVPYVNVNPLYNLRIQASDGVEYPLIQV